MGVRSSRTEVACCQAFTALFVADPRYGSFMEMPDWRIKAVLRRAVAYRAPGLWQATMPALEDST
jgi:hypothetical protein